MLRAGEAGLAGSVGAAGAKEAARAFAGGALKRRVIQGVAAAGTFGGVQTLIARAGDEDVGTQALINTALFGSLGGAFGLLHVPGKTDRLGKIVNRSAYELAQTRMVQATTGDSFYDIFAKLQGLDTADDIAQAALIGKLATDKPFVIPGVTDVSKIIKTVAE